MARDHYPTINVLDFVLLDSGPRTDQRIVSYTREIRCAIWSAW